MSAHVSALVLDELASELPVAAESKAHVEGCSQCGARLAAIKQARAESQKAFGYSRVKARVSAERPPRWRELMPFILPVAAALLFFLVVSIDFGGGKTDTERLKGGASIGLVEASGKKVTEVKPGARLRIEVGAAGNTHALVLAVDKDRNIEELFSGPLPAGAFVTLPKEVEVTPGSVTVHAFLSAAPLDPKLVVGALEGAMRDYAGWPLEAPPPKLEGVTVTSQRLYVTE